VIRDVSYYTGTHGGKGAAAAAAAGMTRSETAPGALAPTRTRKIVTTTVVTRKLRTTKTAPRTTKPT